MNSLILSFAVLGARLGRLGIPVGIAVLSIGAGPAHATHFGQPFATFYIYELQRDVSKAVPGFQPAQIIGELNATVAPSGASPYRQGGPVGGLSQFDTGIYLDFLINPRNNHDGFIGESFLLFSTNPALVSSLPGTVGFVGAMLYGDAFNFPSSSGPTAFGQTFSNMGNPPQSAQGLATIKGTTQSPSCLHTIGRMKFDHFPSIVASPDPNPDDNLLLVADRETACLGSDRFKVKVDWRSIVTDPLQPAMLRNNSTQQQADFYFFNPDNTELLVQVLDMCADFNRFWVFYAASTNVEFELTVTDTQTNQAKTYTNPLGTPFAPIQDTQAFATCP